MKKQIRQTSEMVKERNAFKSDSINHVPLGFTRNYSATANPQISLSNISNEIANQFNSFSVILNQTLSKTITEQIKTSMNELKLEINASVSKFIEKNNENVCYFILDLFREQPAFAKPNEKYINFISSRFNHHNLGRLSTKELNTYVDKLWK